MTPQSEIRNPKSKIFVVDDEPSIRKILLRFLCAAGYEVETFASAREFLDHLLPDPSQSIIRTVQSGASCIVLDIQMPGLSGLDLQEELAKANYSMPIVFLTGHGDVPMSVRAMKKGAADFMLKPVELKDLLTVVQVALAQDRKARREYVERTEASDLIASLTPREHEVMDLVVTGMANKNIADELGISEATVKVHRGRVMEKMRVVSVADLVRKSQKGNMDSGLRNEEKG